MNNACFGLTFQSFICTRYKLAVNNTASAQFNANQTSFDATEFTTLCNSVFESIGCTPVKLLTFTNFDNALMGRKTTSPHNFLLNDGKTLSIRTFGSQDKVAPRTVGQAGYPILNDLFGDIYGGEISSQSDIKQLVYRHIHKMMPIFIDYFFQSDYTVFINRANLAYSIIKSDDVGSYSFRKRDFSFSRTLKDWKESITLKYGDTSIAEIQTHKNRTFKFRFIVKEIPTWLKSVKETNETFGITAEAAICDLFGLKKPGSFKNRVSITLEKQIENLIKESFKIIPKAIEHTGSTPGDRGGQSKCSYDFILDGNQTLSVKTNNNMICPPEVGQPGSKTCLQYFKDYFPPGTTEVTNDAFKIMVFNHITDILPIYMNHLFDSDWMLWIYNNKDRYHFKVIEKEKVNGIDWQKGKISFTKQDVASWNESNTVKFDGVSIGEFQIHHHRACFKFRFNMPALLELISFH